MNRTKEKIDLDFIKKIIDFIESKKGENLVVIDISEVSVISDYVFIVTANSTTHSNSLAKYIVDFFLESGNANMLYNKNLTLDNPWILIDAKDIIINIFLQETREFYSLEKLYFKGKIIYSSSKSNSFLKI